MIRNKRNLQMSESFLTAAFLSASGGLQDAYTYISRGNVFANAQTGNIVLLFHHICEKNLSVALSYLFPLVFFALGVAIAEFIHQKYQMSEQLHWRQLILIVEIMLLFFVGFMPESMNVIANAIVSFSCAMQVQAFRKVNSYAYASTMCIGNMRSGMEALCRYKLTHNKTARNKALHYFGIILFFGLGAALGSRLIIHFEMKAIWFSCILLLISFALMFIKSDESRKI